MKIKRSLFCTMSRNQEWQKWLSNKAPDLLKELLETLEKRSCRANKEKMSQILVALMQRGLTDEFEQLVHERFPWLEDKPPKLMENIKVHSTTKRERPITLSREVIEKDIHGVFGVYKPHLLTFPGKMIIQDPNPESLQRRVQIFTRNKIGVDWLIIGDHAYIEYFFPQYRQTMEKVKPENREIAQYRRKKGLPPDCRKV